MLKGDYIMEKRIMTFGREYYGQVTEILAKYFPGFTYSHFGYGKTYYKNASGKSICVLEDGWSEKTIIYSC